MRNGTEYAPASFVLPRGTTCVPLLVTVTAAFDRTAPVVSVTVPPRVAFRRSWANAAPRVASRAKARYSSDFRMRSLSLQDLRLGTEGRVVHGGQDPKIVH